MNKEEIAIYIQKRLAELDQQKDMKEMITRGRLSFGINSTSYGHLPAWSNLVKQKKQLVRWVWIDAYLLSVVILLIAGDYFNRFAQNWVKALLGLLLLSGVVMVFYVMGFCYALFYQFRKTEREVRKLIYQDILFQLENQEKEAA